MNAGVSSGLSLSGVLHPAPKNRGWGGKAGHGVIISYCPRVGYVIPTLCWAYGRGIDKIWRTLAAAMVIKEEKESSDRN